MEKSKKIKEQFDALYAEWEKVIQDPKIQISSRPQDYTDNEPYRKIVKLGKDALPFISEKMEQGVFFMNEAALKITGNTVDKIIEEEKEASKSKSGISCRENTWIPKRTAKIKVDTEIHSRKVVFHGTKQKDGRAGCI